MVDNDEKVTSSKKPYPVKDRLNGTMGKLSNLFLTKTAKKAIPFGPHKPT